MKKSKDSGKNTKNPSRREFLRQSATVLGAAGAMSMLPPVIRQALAVQAKVVTGTIKDVKHVVILMLENRSFDHYFGTLKGVRGFGDRFPIPLQSGQSVWFQSDGTKVVPPYHLNPNTSRALLVPDCPHDFGTTQAAWNQGKFGFWPQQKSDYSMGHFQRADIPFQFALAEAFTICDSYYCALTSCTDPNRIVFFSGSNFDPSLNTGTANATAANSEVTNGRCAVKGTMPTPGYSYRGSAFTWPTLPDLLQQAGISWRIYQDPNNNWSGLMNGCLAFESFRTAAPGSPIYVNGMTKYTLTNLKNDVVNGTLPAVSWILPSEAESDHPGVGSPLRGAGLVAQVLAALTANPETWSQTALFITYDENDGLFDHVPAPAPPSCNADGTLAGASTLTIGGGEYFSDPTRTNLVASDTISDTVRPWGLGPRVPMYVISPWSKGGWVNSQVFSHTSMGMFLEKRFGITVSSISPWQRAVCGDLTSAFDFKTPNDAKLPTLSSVSNYAAVEKQQKTLPLPIPPATPQPLFQEPGTRYSRALPYGLGATSTVPTVSEVSITFINHSSPGIGAVFHVYDMLHLDRIPRRYTVEAGKSLAGIWNTGADSGQYNLWVYGPNGFVRTFVGNSAFQHRTVFNPHLDVFYNPTNISYQLRAAITNIGLQPGQIIFSDNAYGSGALTLAIPAATKTANAKVITQEWNLSATGYWYDFTATATVDGTNWSRRFAGRVETGKDSISDPVLASGLAPPPGP